MPAPVQQSYSEGGQTLLGGLMGGNMDQQYRPSTLPLSARSHLPPAREAGMPAQKEPVQQQPISGPLSRPLNVGGSRISLLARQLGVDDPSGQNLPPLPEPLKASELQTDGPLSVPVPMPASRKDELGAAMLQQNMRRGGGYTTGRSGGLGKVAAVALLFLGAVAATGYYFKDAVLIALGRPDLSSKQLPLEEEPTLPGLPTRPATVAETKGAGFDPTASAAAPQPTLAVAPVTEPPATTAAEPVPAMVELPSAPAAPATVAPPVEVAKAEPVAVPEPVAPPAPIAPKALPVVEPTQGVPVAALKTEPMNLPPPNPVQNPETKLVEVDLALAKASGAVPSSMPKAESTDALLKGNAPTIKNAPPEVQPAVDGLMSFLNAKTWDERLKYTLQASKVAEKGRSYYQNSADGPIEVDVIEYLRHDTNPQIGKGTHVVFILSGKQWTYSFPVMVEQTDDGARVDWLTFVEFKDDLLRHYLSSQQSGPWSFHVELRRTHYFEEHPADADKMDCFELTSAMGTAHGYAFVPRDSALARSLANTITWDKEVSYVVANLQFRDSPGGKWLELTGLPQLNWYTAE
jgi:hypothetical protein